MKYLFRTIYYISIIVISMLILTIWLNYFVRSNVAVLIISSIITLILISIIVRKNKVKNSNLQQSKEANDHVTKLTQFFTTNNINESLNLINKVFGNNYSLISDRHILANQNEIIITNFYDNNLTWNDVLKIIQYVDLNDKNTTIICIDKAPDIDNKIELLSTNITILTIIDLYTKYKSQFIETFDFDKITKLKQKLKLSDLFKALTKPEYWLRYLLSTLIILTMYPINKNRVYFILCSSLLALLTIICLFKKLTNLHK